MNRLMPSAKLSTAFAAAACAAAIAAQPASAGTFSVGCAPIGFGNIDPIISYGVESHHLHAFKGNKTINPFSTHASLRAATAEQTSCKRNVDKDKPGSGDLSSYWFPTLIRHKLDGTEERLTVVNRATYYGGKHRYLSEIQPFPPGLKMLAWNEHPRDTSKPRNVTYTCSSGGKLVRHDNRVECVDTNLTDGKPSHIGLTARFPSCWDGTTPSDAASDPDPIGKSFDDSLHMAYAVAVNGNNASPWTCPATHPIPVPELLLLAGWQTSGGPDIHPSNHDGYGEHADFFEAWDPEVLEKLVVNCIRVKDANCGQGDSPPPPSDGGGTSPTSPLPPLPLP